MRKSMGPEAGDDQVKQALEFFLAYYREHMLDNTYLYPGVREALDRLLAEKIKMAVLTNKPVRFSQILIDGLGLGGHFLRIYGGNSFEHKKPHPIGVEKLLAETGVARERAMLVGDSAVDVKTARNANIKACGVTYGFQPETFQEARPDILVDRMEELTEMVLRERR
jgi:phosphoglycolate phosphatase